MLYYRGAHVLRLLQQEGKMNVGNLYIRMHETEKMTYPVLMFCLDWLFLINAAVINKNGEISVCTSKQ